MQRQAVLGRVTTHVLDTALGRPAAGLSIELFRLTDEGPTLVNAAITNSDGRTDSPILDTDVFELGEYELLFHAGDYLKTNLQITDGKQFLDTVPIRFKVSDDAHFHVPLLLSPYGYSTYRGS